MKKILYILLFTSIVSTVTAQTSYMSWQYTMGFTTGNLNDYISQTSFRGVTYDYTKLVNGGVGVGLEIGWNTFYEKKSYDTYSYNNFDLSGKQYRYNNNVPLPPPYDPPVGFNYYQNDGIATRVGQPG